MATRSQKATMFSLAKINYRKHERTALSRASRRTIKAEIRKGIV